MPSLSLLPRSSGRRPRFAHHRWKGCAPNIRQYSATQPPRYTIFLRRDQGEAGNAQDYVSLLAIGGEHRFSGRVDGEQAAAKRGADVDGGAEAKTEILAAELRA